MCTKFARERLLGWMLVPTFVACRVLSIRTPFLGLEVRIHEVCRVEMRAVKCQTRSIVYAWQYVLAKNGSLKRLRLARETKAGLQLVHRWPERTTTFDSQGCSPFNADGWWRWRCRMHRKRNWGLVKLYTVVTWCVVCRCLIAGDRCNKVERARDWRRGHGGAWERRDGCALRLWRRARIAII